MCDYSLEGLPNRLAVEGEQLTTYRFRTGSIGMASPADIATRLQMRRSPNRGSWWAALKNWMSGPTEKDEVCAVCIAPGTRLLMSRIPDRLRRTARLDAVANVTFTQLSAEAFQFRDAIRVADGREIPLQSIPTDVMFQVLWNGPRDSAGDDGVDSLASLWPLEESTARRP